MGIIDTVSLSVAVLRRLATMDYENKKENNGSSEEQLIFPVKIQGKGKKFIDRISEQELRLLFIEEFKKVYKEFFYSIETPTEGKYSFKSNEKSAGQCQSALIDMCIFERYERGYKRILDIEFKHKNTALKNIEKDIWKLISEKYDGVFLHLLNNTNRGTLCNNGGTGVFDKYRRSFEKQQGEWKNEEKSVQIIIISLKQKTIIHRTLMKEDLSNLDTIFFKDEDGKNITEIDGNGWVRLVC